MNKFTHLPYSFPKLKSKFKMFMIYEEVYFINITVYYYTLQLKN